MTSDSDNQPRRHGRGRPDPLGRQATTDVLAVVIKVEIDDLLRRPIHKNRALHALAA